MISIIIDASIVILVFLFTIIGYKQGLIKVAIKIFSFIIAIVLAFTLYKPVSSSIINKTSIDENISNVIMKNIQGEDGKTFEIKGLPDKISNSITTEANNKIDLASNTIAIKIIQAATFLIIFIVVKILLQFISAIADWIAKLPILKQFNKLGGTIYGFAKGVVIIYLIFAIILMISPLIKGNITQEINNSHIGSILYNHNLLINLIFKK